ncbi:hypothetical protein ACP70R_049873 [Stipagrostis hirtigluma subsp. patula]
MDEATRTRSCEDGGDRSLPATGSVDGEDLISLLPDCVLGEIVGRLPIRDAVRVPVLSSRWRRLWRGSPLNLDDRLLRGVGGVHILCLISHVLAIHPGPARRLRIGSVSVAGHSADYDHWLRSRAVDGLQVLEIHPGAPCLAWRAAPPLPPAALRFARSLRALRIGSCVFPSGAAAATLRFPHLELLSFCGVSISETALHGLLAGCPALVTLVLDECFGFSRVRITSPTVRSLAVSAAHSMNPMPEVTMREVVVEDAPRLENLAPFRHQRSGESFELRVVSAPKLRFLGCVSMAISKLELGTTVFRVTDCRVKHVQNGNVQSEEVRSEMRAVRLGTTLPTLKSLALEDVDRTDVVCNFLRCFPSLEKLYVSAREGFKTAGSYDKQNPIECLELHLRKIVLNGYEGERSDVRFAKLFVLHARVLKSMRIRYRSKSYETLSEEWIADQRRQLQVNKRASQHAKFNFLHDYGYNYTDLPEHIHDSSTNEPFDAWFEQ